MLRIAARPAHIAARAARTARGYSTEFQQTREAVKHHAAGSFKDLAKTTQLWRRVSIFVCIPAIVIGSVWTYKLEAEHHAHIEHIKHEHGGELPEPVLYPYINIRNKPFPWGMQSLFFNPELNIKAGDE